MKRADVLDAAKAAVTQDRQATHGNPEDTFGAIARLWSAYLDARIAPSDVARMMVLLKVARTRQNPKHADSWVDICGYGSCGAELAGAD